MGGSPMAIENVPPWDTLVEAFALAEAGRDITLYSEARLRRT